MQLKLMSWNIWHGKYLDKVIEHIKKENPNIVALQEIIESETVENLAKQIADKLGYEYSYCRAFFTDRHTPFFEQGNAILSRSKIVDSECVFLSGMEYYRKDSETEPRVAIRANIEINGKSLNVISTHLGYTSKFKDSELRQLQIDNLIKLISDKQMVLMGDFNCLPQSPEIKKIEKVLKNADSNPTKPTWIVYANDEGGLEYRIDNIFVSSDIEVKEFRVEDSKASDHLPISAIIKI